jgi:hypothetical protein
VSTLSLPNLSLIAAVVSCLIQVGAQLFAVVVVVATVTEAPPRSLANVTISVSGRTDEPVAEIVRTPATLIRTS